jgi:hypothetical protein
VTRYQLGLVFQAALRIVPPSAFTAHGTCESAMNAALSASRSPAKDARNCALSRNKEPFTGGRIGGTGADDDRVLDERRRHGRHSFGERARQPIRGVRTRVRDASAENHGLLFT